MFVVGDPASVLRKQSYERYHCHESAKSVSRPAMSDVCAKLILSMSAIINDGSLRKLPYYQEGKSKAMELLCDHNSVVSEGYLFIYVSVAVVTLRSLPVWPPGFTQLSVWCAWRSVSV